MISVMIIWLYMLFTCYVTGFACIKAISGNAKFEAQREISYLYAGIGAVTVYAQFFSIFWRVGLLLLSFLLMIFFNSLKFTIQIISPCLFFVYDSLPQGISGEMAYNTSYHEAVTNRICDRNVFIICLWDFPGNHSL